MISDKNMGNAHVAQRELKYLRVPLAKSLTYLSLFQQSLQRAQCTAAEELDFCHPTPQPTEKCLAVLDRDCGSAYEHVDDGLCSKDCLASDFDR